MAESRCQAIQCDLRLPRCCHGWRQFADCKDFEKFRDVISVLLIPGIVECGEDRGRGLFDESGLLTVSIRTIDTGLMETDLFMGL